MAPCIGNGTETLNRSLILREGHRQALTIVDQKLIFNHK